VSGDAMRISNVLATGVSLKILDTNAYGRVSLSQRRGESTSSRCCQQIPSSSSDTDRDIVELYSHVKAEGILNYSLRSCTYNYGFL